jgi:hypothetical protein
MLDELLPEVLRFTVANLNDCLPPAALCESNASDGPDVD